MKRVREGLSNIRIRIQYRYLVQRLLILLYGTGQQILKKRQFLLFLLKIYGQIVDQVHLRLLFFLLRVSRIRLLHLRQFLRLRNWPSHHLCKFALQKRLFQEVFLRVHSLTDSSTFTCSFHLIRKLLNLTTIYFSIVPPN